MLPQAFIKRIREQLKDADDFIAALDQPPITSIRKHPSKNESTFLELGDEVKWCPSSYYLKQRPIFTLDPAFHAGAYYVQESSSMFLWKILDEIFDNKNQRILDLCAAPGGKSTLISSWLNGSGVLISNEIIKSRAQILLENITKWGYANNWVTSADSYVLGGLDEFFDCILIDAPCSGEGLFRRDPNAMNEWSEANCELCAGRQRKIVAEILPALAVGGYLIYSTCTFNPAENDENIEWLINEFQLELVELDFDQISEIRKTPVGGFAFYPQNTKGEGFYCCVLKKATETDSNAGVRKQKIKFDFFDQKKFPLSTYLKKSNNFDFFQINSKIVGIPAELNYDFNMVASVTKILGGFLVLGEIKGKDLIPDHSLAMSVYLGSPFPVIELGREESLLYLSKKDLKLDNENMGWCTVSFESQPLGFIKNLPTRINNYYPVEWRIRMDV